MIGLDGRQFPLHGQRFALARLRIAVRPKKEVPANKAGKNPPAARFRWAVTQFGLVVSPAKSAGLTGKKGAASFLPRRAELFARPLATPPPLLSPCHRMHGKDRKKSERRRRPSCQLLPLLFNKGSGLFYYYNNNFGHSFTIQKSRIKNKKSR